MPNTTHEYPVSPVDEKQPTADSYYLRCMRIGLQPARTLVNVMPVDQWVREMQAGRIIK